MPVQKKMKKPVKQYKKKAVKRYRRPYVRGRGDYFIGGGAYAEGKIPGIGKAGIGIQGGYSKGNAVIPTVHGLGAYDVSKIRHNVLLHGDPPVIRNSRSREGAVIFRHREYIQDIVSSSTTNTFKVDSFPLNPGMSQTFPWLAQCANSFEEYVLNGIIFEFKSITSDAISSSSLATIGEVILATQYDALNPPFSSNQQMLNYEFAQVCKASHDCLHMIECDPHQTAVSSHLYTRSGSVPGNADLRLYDHGTFYIASNQISGTSVVLGQLWVTYEVLLYKPKIPTSEPYAANYFKAVSTTGTVSNNNPLGTSWIYPPGYLNSMSILLTGTSITFPVTQGLISYLVLLNWNSLTAMAASYPNLTFTNCKRINAWQSGFASNMDAAPQSLLAGTTTECLSFIISTTSPGILPAIISLANNAGLSGLNNNVDIVISEIPYMDPNIYGSS